MHYFATRPAAKYPFIFPLMDESPARIVEPNAEAVKSQAYPLEQTTGYAWLKITGYWSSASLNLTPL